MLYRSDIDGLRATAIIPVVLFHAGFVFFNGGFIGVDIFFVISGFLITQILHKSIVNGHFTFKKFYVNRARRLLPALFFTLLVTFVISALLLSPSHMEEMSGSLVFTLFSMANFFFLGRLGYFDISTQFRPLLHVWSLAVEGQFYLIWPICFLGLLKHRVLRSRPVIVSFLLVVFLVSLVAAVALGESKSSFYFTPLRFYEFILGILAALVPLQLARNGLKEIAFLSGSAMILMAIFVLEEDVAYPSYYALLPALGAYLVIQSNQPKYTGYLLSNPFCIYVGKISYSLYLIHWPVIVFLGYLGLRENAYEAYWVLGISLVLAALMHRYVELPFRFYKHSFAYGNFGKLTLGVGLILLVVSTHAWTTGGWEWRFSTRLVETMEEALEEGDEKSRAKLDAHVSAFHETYDPSLPILLFVGDSHSQDMFNAMVTVKGLDANLYHMSLDEKCFKKADFEPTLAQKMLGFKGNSISQSCKESFPIFEADPVRFKADVIVMAVAYPVNEPKELARIKTMIDYHKSYAKPGAKLFLVGSNRLPFDPPTLYMMNEGTLETNNHMAVFNRTPIEQTNENVKAIADKEGVGFIDLLPLICDKGAGTCQVVSDDGKLLFRDDNHWSYVGEAYFGQLIYDRYGKNFFK